MKTLKAITLTLILASTMEAQAVVDKVTEAAIDRLYDQVACHTSLKYAEFEEGPEIAGWRKDHLDNSKAIAFDLGMSSKLYNKLYKSISESTNDKMKMYNSTEGTDDINTVAYTYNFFRCELIR